MEHLQEFLNNCRNNRARSYFQNNTQLIEAERQLNVIIHTIDNYEFAYVTPDTIAKLINITIDIKEYVKTSNMQTNNYNLFLAVLQGFWREIDALKMFIDTL